MGIQYILGGILAALTLLVALAEIVSWLSRSLRDQAAQAYLEQHPMGKSYAVGSPEYNAQVVQVIHQINEQVALQGKRLPERAVIEMIRQMEESE